MKYRNLGSNGIKVSVISLGGWLTYGFNINDENANKALDEALNQGINFIDVADAYNKGESESAVGRFLKQQERSDLVISSKVYGQMSNNVNNKGLSHKHILESIDKSLDRLKTSYLDIYYCHRYDYSTPLEETIRAMNLLIDQGKIMYWGTSTWFPAEIERAHAIARNYGLRPPVVEQPRYNLLDRHIENLLWYTIDGLGMGVTPWSPLAQGILTGKYNDGIPENSRHATYMKLADRELNEGVLVKLRKLAEIAKDNDMTLAQLSLSWALSRPQISSLITGASKASQVTENAAAGDIVLSRDVVTEIEAIMDNDPSHHPVYGINYKKHVDENSN
ncbi:MAG: L-glyceraldehyde 3-phosphate reductase [Candidatus Heimdallarchaeota archaeon LC_2]|nr:MAG: L-glyceraldehyde 3-phosphate reductase [Candidatus Heimdallarchaeota archaeon LC_2]